jgi:hypothetical protein
LAHISAGWIVSGAADPAVGANDHGRNVCAYRVGDVAAVQAVAESNAIAIAVAIVRAMGIAIVRAFAIAIAIAVIVAPAVETKTAIVTATVIAKDGNETMGATTPVVESGNAAAMKAPTMKATALKAAAREAVRRSGSGEQDHQQCETGA